MKTQAISCALFVAIYFVCQVGAQPAATLLPPLDGNAIDQGAAAKDKKPAKDKEKDKKLPEKKLVEPPKFDFFPPLTSAVGNFPTFFNPGMMGEKQVWFARQRLAITGTQTTTITTVNVLNVGTPLNTTTVATAQVRTVLVPIPQRGGSNIAENASPMPTDRVFGSWNYYNNVGFGSSGPNAPITTTTITTQPNRGNFGGTQTTVTTVIPGAPRVDLNREVFGFEKTFLDGYASISLRAATDQMGGGGANFGYSNFGDLTVVGKYALYLDRAAGNVLSTGVAVTVPTGRSIPTTAGNFHDTLFQPFAGYVWNFNRFYVQGFHSVLVPTDKQDVTLAYNDFGINYWLYRTSPDRFLTYLVPSTEVHITTPMNHRDLNGPIVVPDTVVLTSGIHIGLGRFSTLSFGAAMPVTGPRPYNVEGFVLFNRRF